MSNFGWSATLRVLTLLALAKQTSGLEFTLTRPDGNQASPKAPCGVLLCEQNGTGSSDNSRSFKSMALFKARSSGQGSHRELAFLSPAQSTVDLVFDGMKISGSFKYDQASLRVELPKQKDCSAEFICELHEEDSTGTEMVSSFRLLQQHDPADVATDETSPAPGTVSRLVSLIQGLDVKLAVMEKTSERLEYKLNSFESSLEHQVADLKTEMIDRMHVLQNAFQDKLNSLEHSVQNKASSNFEKMEEKLCQLDSKLSILDSDTTQGKVLSTIQTQIDTHFLKLQNVSERAGDMLTETASLLTSFSCNNTNFQDKIIDRYHTVLDNVNRGVDELVTRTRNLTSTLEHNFSSLKDDIDLTWQRLESNTSKCVAETSSLPNGVPSALSSTPASSTASAVTGQATPEGCTRTASAALAQSSTPTPGLHTVQVPGVDTPVLCDTVTDGGGWIVIQRRSTGDVDFYRNWASYRDGFGTFGNDFWLGNEKIHNITSNGEYELRVDLQYKDESRFALYDTFYLAGEGDNYKLFLGAYTGTAGDDLTQHSGCGFTTRDRDNDIWGGGNCAESYTGAWWFNNCLGSNLNGKWEATNSQGLCWGPFTFSNSASFSEMKIRRVD